MLGIVSAMQRFVRRFGYDVVKYQPSSHGLARRIQLLRSFGIETVIDVGAGAGQYGRQLRGLGFKGRIISFEPLRNAFERLRPTAERDGAWQAFNIALGDADGKTVINVAGNSDSSSLLNMLDSHIRYAPESKCVGRQEIEVKRLDSVFDSICGGCKGVYLKIDTQGYEDKVLAGAERSLNAIDTIQVEMSLVPLYEGQALFPQMYQRLCGLGYCVVALEPGFSDRKTGRLLQIDGIFHRFREV